jgi:hypothetical protein
MNHLTRNYIRKIVEKKMATVQKFHLRAERNLPNYRHKENTYVRKLNQMKSKTYFCSYESIYESTFVLHIAQPYGGF